MAVEQLITQHIDTWTSALRTRSTAGRGNSGKIDLYGIKKLRELILELAVRGKLVPQDPNDEPASELLKRIAAEKAELVKQGKIKKQKPLPEISEDEKPFELPVGWEWVRLGALFNSIASGGTPSKSNPDFWNGEIPWASVKDLSKDKYITKTQDYISQQGLVEGSKLADKGDILICTRMGLGKIGIASCPVAFNQDLKSVKLTSCVSVDFFFNTYSTVKIKGTGTTVEGIKQEQLLNYVIGLPSDNEQQKIDSKIKVFMSLCDQLEQQSLTSLDAHYQLVETLLATLTASQNAEDLAESWARISQYFDTLFTTEASIDALKQTILQLAVMGKLIPQDPNDEPASELLKRIEQEKAQLVKEGKIKKQKPLPPISDEEKPFELPMGWKWCRLADLVTIKGGKRVSNGYKLRSEPTPHVYIRVADMKDGTVDLSDLKYIDAEMHKKIDKYIITKDDIYMTIVGATIGKCGIIPDVLDGMNLTENAARLIPFPLITRDYLYLCLRSDFCQTQFVDKTMQVGVQKMALIRLANTLIPLPPTDEGLRIKSEVEEINNIFSSLSTRIIAAQQTQVHLADALTDAALN